DSRALRTLRDLLAADVAQRLNLAPETLQVDFKPLDEKVLNLSEPLFKFQIEPTRVRNLGNVEWDVTIITETGNRKITIAAAARAWQNQEIRSKPLGYRQLIQEGDVVEKRVLVDALPDDALVTKTQA